ncbi:MAG: NAD(P)H-dependent oxidoreductase [Cellulomonas sp.]|jgi:NAD(P)H-dependent FMN reductase|uniref:NADPH-dependent FMN reductase n=1 Tax=Cellulomonas sp. TaxID=40001 RepID=UPI0019E2AC02|nr:NAD(P)H-dependent oxidoreductase [Cellulomonas sp.]MBF0688205.1 NAD(P)H-dependent oxidoreductase [Cellulomonas sp.]
MSTTTDLRVLLVVGSVRDDRRGHLVADWVRDRLAEHGGLEVDVADLRDVTLPASLDGSGDTAAWRARIDAADAFVVVTPEYNHGYPGYLKIAIDSAYDQWRGKTVAFASYGGTAGGARAVEQLRPVFAEVHAHTVRDQVVLPNIWELIDDEGVLDASRAEAPAKAMLEQLVWWGTALRTARQADVAA